MTLITKSHMENQIFLNTASENPLLCINYMIKQSIERLSQKEAKMPSCWNNLQVHVHERLYSLH